METNKEKKILEFYGGGLISWLPLLVFIVLLLCAAVTGHINMYLYAAAGMVAVILAFILAKDKKAMDDIVIDALCDRSLCTMVAAFLLAGILSQLLRQSGLISGLIWLAGEMNLNASFLPVITFLTCVLISTSCGTTGGTVTAVTPIMLPLSVELGANPAVIMGAIMGGSIFGDNLAPISDTTIASALTQETSISEVVKTRLPFSLIGGGISAVLYIILGLTASGGVSAAIEGTDPTKAPTLVLLILPIVMVILMLKGMGLIATMIVCILLGTIIDVVFGFVSIAQMISTDGPFAAGLSGMAGITIFVMVIMIVVEITKRSGAFDKLVDVIVNCCDTPRKVELGACLIAALGILTTGGSTISIITVGPYVRQMTKKAGIARTRGANIIDGISTGVAGILPYNSSLLTALSLAIASGAVPENFSSLQFLPYTFHCFALLILFVGSALTGIGRKMEA